MDALLRCSSFVWLGRTAHRTPCTALLQQPQKRYIDNLRIPKQKP